MDTWLRLGPWWSEGYPGCTLREHQCNQRSHQRLIRQRQRQRQAESSRHQIKIRLPLGSGGCLCGNRCAPLGGFNHDPGALYSICSSSSNLDDTNCIYSGGRRVEGNSPCRVVHTVGEGGHQGSTSGPQAGWVLLLLFSHPQEEREIATHFRLKRSEPTFRWFQGLATIVVQT